MKRKFLISFFRSFSIYSLRSKLTASFLALGFIPMLILGITSYKLYYQNLHDNVTTYSYEVIERIDKNLETYVSDIENILQLRNDYYVQQYLKLNEAGNIEGNRKYTVRIWETFDSLKKMKTDLVNIRLISHNGSTISCYGNYWEDISEDPLYSKLVNSTYGEVAIQAPYINMQNKNVFSIGKVFGGYTIGGAGIMCIDIDVNFLVKICNDIKLVESGYVFIENNGKVIFSPGDPELQGYSADITKNSELLNAESGSFITNLNNTNYVVTYKTSAITGWKIVGVSPEAVMTRDISMMGNVLFWLIASIIIIIVMLTVYLTNVISDPIKELRGLMKRASENDLSIYAEIKTRDEIGQLASSFNKMINKIKELMSKVVEDQLKIRKMEMKAMQELIKPHFVYNTLDSIIGLLEQNRNEDAMNMIASLGKFFRTSLSHGREVVLIREEIDHIRSYLMIQQFRFSNKFDYMFELDEDILKLKTIKLILQPLVENCIYHGVRNLTKKGLIVINGYIKDEQVFFEISDNGEGITEDKIQHINKIMSGEETVEDENIYFGIRNVNDRIKLNFGAAYGLRYQSMIAVGTKVIVSIPQVK